MKKIFGVIAFIIILVGLSGASLAAASGLLQVPLLTPLFKADKPKDLGIDGNAQMAVDLIKRHQVKIKGNLFQACLNCPLSYSEASPLNVALTSEQLTSLLKETNDQQGVLRNLQIKLGDHNQLEMSAWLDLNPYQVKLKSPVYARGSIRANGKHLLIKIDLAKLGIVPVTDKYIQRAQKELNQLVNRQLDRMSGLTIDKLSIENGRLIYQGNFPHLVQTY
jgi:hypothetical protein